MAYDENHNPNIPPSLSRMQSISVDIVEDRFRHNVRAQLVNIHHNPDAALDLSYPVRRDILPDDFCRILEEEIPRGNQIKSVNLEGFSLPFNSNENTIRRFQAIDINHQYNVTASHLRRVFAVFPRLEAINLAYNAFMGSDSIGEVCNHFHQLKSVTLHHTGLTPLSAGILSNALATTTTLEELDISHNHLHMFRRQIQYIEPGHHPVSLLIREPGISQVVETLAQGLEANTSLVRLKIDHNNLTEECETRLKVAFDQNPAAREIAIDTSLVMATENSPMVNTPYQPVRQPTNNVEAVSDNIAAPAKARARK